MPKGNFIPFNIKSDSLLFSCCKSQYFPSGVLPLLMYQVYLYSKSSLGENCEKDIAKVLSEFLISLDFFYFFDVFRRVSSD